MYNRYIPQNDGTFRRSTHPDPARQEPAPAAPDPQPPAPPPEPAPRPCPPGRRQFHQRTASRHRDSEPEGIAIGSFLRQLLPRDLDTGDLIVILLLLLMCPDSREDQNTAMLTLVLYLFL